MGGYLSQTDAGSPSGYEAGLRITMIEPNSPVDVAGLVPFLDVICAIDGKRTLYLAKSLDDLLQSLIDRPVLFTIYNQKTRRLRDIEVTPSKKWGGPSLLGVVFQFVDLTAEALHPIRILSVQPGSPAAESGLEAENDYILGKTDDSFKTIEAFNSFISRSIDKDVAFFVYNSRKDTIRTVILRPNKKWGDGSSLLGVEAGVGAFHSFPEERTRTVGSFEFPETYVPFSALVANLEPDCGCSEQHHHQHQTSED